MLVLSFFVPSSSPPFSSLFRVPLSVFSLSSLCCLSRFRLSLNSLSTEVFADSIPSLLLFTFSTNVGCDSLSCSSSFSSALSSACLLFFVVRCSSLFSLLSCLRGECLSFCWSHLFFEFYRHREFLKMSARVRTCWKSPTRLYTFISIALFASRLFCS